MADRCGTLREAAAVRQRRWTAAGLRQPDQERKTAGITQGERKVRHQQQETAVTLM